MLPLALARADGSDLGFTEWLSHCDGSVSLNWKINWELSWRVQRIGPSEQNNTMSSRLFIQSDWNIQPELCHCILIYPYIFTLFIQCYPWVYPCVSIFSLFIDILILIVLCPWTSYILPFTLLDIWSRFGSFCFKLVWRAAGLQYPALKWGKQANVVLYALRQALQLLPAPEPVGGKKIK